MALLTAQPIPENSSLELDLNDAAAAAGDSVAWNAENILMIENSHVSEARTVTIANKKSVFGLAASSFNQAVTVAAGKIRMVHIGSDRFKDATTALTEWTYSDSAADLTVAVVRRSAAA
jgi:hypothetical protein